jgi:hypothetical protein
LENPTTPPATKDRLQRHIDLDSYFVGCVVWFSALLLLGCCGCCYLTGFLPLLGERARWEAQNIEDYHITVIRSGPGNHEEFVLTIRNDRAVHIDCTPNYSTRYNSPCPYADLQDWDMQFYSPEALHRYTVDGLYADFLFRSVNPFCHITINPDQHYPESFGCGFIEGQYGNISDFQAFDCSGPIHEDDYLAGCVPR